MSEVIRTTCPYCGVGCGLRVSRQDGAPRIEADPQHPANFGRICNKGAALGETLDLEGRLLHPVVQGRRASWERALDTVAGAFREAIDRYGPDSVAFYVSGQMLTEDYYVANKLMKGFIGSANIDTNSRLCMSSSVAGHQRAFGEDLVPGCYEDLEEAELIVIVGGNSAWCHPVLFQRIQAAREKHPQRRLVVIDPRRTATAESADLHLPLKPGSDVALFNGLFRYLADRGLACRDFVAARTSGFDAALEACGSAALEAVAAECGLEPADLLRFYELFAARERSVTLYSQGVNQSTSGTDKVNAIINCHLLTGRIGRPGCGPFSLTGQPNAMGGREAGGLATTLAAHMGFDAADVERVGRFWNSSAMARKPGLKAVDLFRAAGAGEIKAIWIMGTNPAVSLPDAGSVRRALRRCDFVAVSDCMAETDTTALAHVLLPAATWGEKNGTVTNSERRISRQRPFLPPAGEARPDWWIIGEVAARLGHAGAFSYRHPAEIFREHARLSAFENEGERLFNIGALSELSEAQYDALAPLQWPVTERDALGSARLRLGDDSRPLRFVALEPRPAAHAPDADYPLILNSGRLRDHWHTMTRSGKSPRLNRVMAEPSIAVHPRDAQALSLREHHLAEVKSRWGSLQAPVTLDRGLRPGEVFVPMHWNDQFSLRALVGAVVNPATDPLSGEPEFKHTPVRLRALPMTWYGFLLTRRRPEAAHINGLAYWVRIRELAHWRLEMAGREAQSKWGPWAKRLMGAVRPDADWLEFLDPRAGAYRVASLDHEGRLEACLMLAPEPELLPERDWLKRLFDRPHLEPFERAALLAGAAPPSFSRAAS